MLHTVRVRSRGREPLAGSTEVEHKGQQQWLWTKKVTWCCEKLTVR